MNPHRLLVKDGEMSGETLVEGSVVSSVQSVVIMKETKETKMVVHKCALQSTLLYRNTNLGKGQKYIECSICDLLKKHMCKARGRIKNKLWINENNDAKLVLSGIRIKPDNNI